MKSLLKALPLCQKLYITQIGTLNRWLNKRKEKGSNLGTHKYIVLEYISIHLISLPQCLSKIQYLFQMLIMANTYKMMLVRKCWKKIASGCNSTATKTTKNHWDFRAVSSPSLLAVLLKLLHSTPLCKLMTVNENSRYGKLQ